MESHLKRFFIETYQDESMYEDYLTGKAFLNREDYRKWYSKMKVRNSLFSDMLTEVHNINSRVVVESALSKHLAVSSSFFCKKEIIESDFGFPKIEAKINLKEGNSKAHYICNGCFTNTLEQIYQVLSSGSFSVGICCEKKTDLFRETVQYYNQLKDILLKSGYNAFSIESNCSMNNRIYLLKYNSCQGKVIRKSR